MLRNASIVTGLFCTPARGRSAALFDAGPVRGRPSAARLAEQFDAIVVGAADPRPFYAELRQRAPVYRTPIGFWYVTRYDLARAIMRSDAQWSVSAASASSHAEGTTA